MDILDSRYFRINKFSFSFIGQWPFQSNRMHYISSAIILGLAGSNIIAKVIATASLGSDISGIVDDLLPLFCDLVATIKLVNNILQMKKMRLMLRRIQSDYATITSGDELKIMYKYADGGRKFTILYISLLFVTMLGSTVTPMLAIIASFRNGSDERVYIHHTEYFVDPSNYYFFIILHSYIIIIYAAYVIASMDALLVVIMQHACGLFTALGHRLHQLVNSDGDLVELYPCKKNDKYFETISLSVRRHQQAIEFANLVDSYYSTSFFLQAAINMMGLSAGGIQLMTMTETDTLFQHASVLITALLHIFFECVYGQRLIDHSSRLHEYLIDVKWYQMSLRTRKILNFMVLRARQPCVLTAAGTLVVSMETFSAIIRTSMSYFTVLRSTQ